MKRSEKKRQSTLPPITLHRPDRRLSPELTSMADKKSTAARKKNGAPDLAEARKGKREKKAAPEH